MKRNCIFTVNIGNFITNLSKDSMLAACERWHCDYAEIHEHVRPEYASCSKYVGPRRLTGYDKIMMVDGDMVISAHAPNPFNFVTQENIFFAVSDYMQEPNHCKEWLEGPYKQGIERVLEVHPEFVTPQPETFFNGGMWMCVNNETIRAMFQFALDLVPCNVYELGNTFNIEQGTINVAVHNTPGIKLCLLPETWNHMIPKGGKPSDDYYINHFGGWAHTLLNKMSRDYDAARSRIKA